MTSGPGEPSPDDEVVERFRPTSGRLTGALALVIAGTVLVLALFDPAGVPAPVAALCVLGAVLAWAAMLRPGLWATREHLVMRNMFETVTIPLAAIEEVVVRQVVVVRAGEQRLVSTVVGHSWRKALRSPSSAAPESQHLADLAYPDFVAERLSRLAEDARAAAGVRRYSDEQEALARDVRRRPAWLPIGLIAVAAVAVVVSLFL